MNTEKKIINKVKTLLGIEVKLEQMKLDNGAVLEAESFEVGAEVFVVADEERVAVPIGEYVLEDGKSLKVVEEGIIAEIGEASAEEEEAPAEVVEEEEELATETAAPKKIVKSISEEMFFSEIEKLRAEISELKLSKEVVEVKEVVELSKQDEVEGITHNPENATAKKELHLYAQKAQNTIQNRVFNTINKK
tara:strand:- start:46 stop:621 length:576 start_codon:yes stop_codon:yes gene_type:complete